MGRYAFFNTGVEYKFSFGIQNSGDIMLFGGLGNPFGCAKSAEPFHTWTEEDAPFVLRRIREIEKDVDLAEIEFSDFVTSVKGTYDLKSYLSNLFNRYDEKVIAKYILGCIIYHQLLYNNVLEVTYEL